MADITHSDVPAGLGAEGRALWLSVTSDYDLERHELLLLERAARTADMIANLDVALANGVLLTPMGKIRPEIVERRQQDITFARLLAALRVPLGAEEEKPGSGPARLQRRSAPRGVYGLGSAP